LQAQITKLRALHDCPLAIAVKVSRPGAMLKRLNSSTVVWYWLYNALRLMSAVILLPLVLHKLPTPELGM
jgi:hypothetical protein